MSVNNLINIMSASAGFAFFLAMIFRFKPSWWFINGGLGAFVGLLGAVAVNMILATTNDAFILAGMAAAVFIQIIVTKRIIGSSSPSRSKPAERRPAGIATNQASAPNSEEYERTAASMPEAKTFPGANRVFLSYRRQDSEDIIGRIYDRLVRDLGEEAVFKDVDSIPLGVDFRTHIAKQLQNCEYFLAVIGKDWLDIEDSDGMRRIDDVRDHVRLETLVALQKGMPVIPVLVRGAGVPPAARLPDDLKDLSYRNGLSVRPDPDFHRDMDRLIAQISNNR